MDIFYFKVKYGLNSDGKSSTIISGLLHGESYSHAAGQIENYFNAELLEIINLRRKEGEFGCEDRSLIFLPDEISKKYVEYDFNPINEFKRK